MTKEQLLQSLDHGCDVSVYLILKKLEGNGGYKYFGDYENYKDMSVAKLAEHLYNLIYAIIKIEKSEEFVMKDYIITYPQMFEVVAASNLGFFVEDEIGMKIFEKMVEVAESDYMPTNGDNE